MNAGPDLWWIREPWLAGGANPDDATLAALGARGFGAIVCLLGPDEAPRHDVARARATGWCWFPLPIVDFTAPTPDQARTFVDLVERLERGGTRTFVHCAAGKGRTGTLAAIRYVAGGMAADDAIARVRALRPGAVEGIDQETAVAAFARLRSAGSLSQQRN